jgi:pimeloyl-ACP methyl ester carboxylesterase
MKKSEKINGISLEYEVKGSGEPLLLISTGPIADSFDPFLSEKALTERYCMIAYHQRGQAGSSRGPGTDVVSFEQHAADAAALLNHLGISRAHVAGHSTGAAIALELAVHRSSLVHSLILLEPPLTAARSAGVFFDKAGPALAAHQSGESKDAMAKFLSVVSGLDWETCCTVLQKHVPGSVAQAMKDADNFFGGYLAALNSWQFDSGRAASIAQPLLSVLGTATDPWFAESHELLHAWFPRIDDCAIEGVGHLLHMQRPGQVLSGVGAWLARHPMRDAPSSDAACAHR